MKTHSIRRLALSIQFLGILLFTGAVSAQVPDTPAGRVFTSWLNAINSGDRATLQQFIDKSMPGRPVEPALNLFRQSGGYEVKRIESSSNTRVVALAQERAEPKMFVRITFNVAADAPDRVAGVGIMPTEPPAELAPPKLTAAQAEAARSTPPYRQFAAWLEAFNSGEPERLRQYIENYYQTANVDGQLNFRQRTGGFELRKVEQATPTSLVGLIQERNSDQFARFNVTVEPAAPHKITRFGISGIPRPAEFPVAALSEPELVNALRDKLEKDAAADRFSGTAILAKLGSGAPKVLFSGAYGRADREKNVANALDTRFRIGSMNKMFTATSILQLVQAGKLKLTDPLSKVMPDYPNQDLANKVTIHHLLTHTGGTGDIFGPEFSARRLELRTHTDYVNLYGKRALLFEPGSEWRYSNYGMLLLGAVVEKVTGQTYYDYVTEHIFRPAGMTRSGSEPESEDVLGRSVGYMQQQGNWTPNTNTLPYRGTAAGGGYSTVEDLLKFANALMSHKLLNAQYTELLITGKVESGPGRMYAYGFDDSRKNGVGSVGHGGGAPGMNGDLRIYPKTGYVVAVLSNLDPPAATLVANYLDLRLPK
jgi:CubicO group peptidase (beta-lactamase class C family)